MGQFLPLGERCGFPKVNHPDFGPSVTVMNEQQGTADDLANTQRGTEMNEMRIQEINKCKQVSSFINTLCVCLRLLEISLPVL